jgi:hypothetical protein
VRSGNTTDPIDVVNDRAELDRLHDRAAENRRQIDELLSFHESGKLLLNVAVEAHASYSGALRHKAIGFVASPLVVLPSLWDFPTGDPFPSQVADVVVEANQSDLASQWVRQFREAHVYRWYDHNRSLTVGKKDSSVLYVDRFGHIGAAMVAQSDDISISICIRQLEQFAHVAETAYRDHGYFGSVQLLCLLLVGAGSIRPPLRITARALDLASTVEQQREEIRSDLLRLAGVLDNW